MSKVWKTAAVDADLASRVADGMGIPAPVARVLVVRGYTEPQAIERFLNPRLADVCDPFRLPDMDKAVERILGAIDRKERIVVFGDYDVDGISSTALLVQVLRRLGADTEPFLPHRIDDGYGLAPDTLERCSAQLHPRLVVTVDCGTTANEAVRAASKAGVDVVVTDHHEAGGEVAPAHAVVNPKLGTNADARNLAGVGVAFKLGYALVKKAREQGRQGAAEVDLREYLDLVALGTVADIVPLVGENRILARHGLALLNRTKSIGLQALIHVAGIRGWIDTYHVGFLLGPRLNAVGRLGDAQAALKLLVTDDEAEAERIAAQLDAVNRERQDVEAKIVREAMAEIDEFFDPSKHFGLVVARAGWHPGVVGIVASRLSARYHRPAVVIGIDPEAGTGRGSARSIEGFNLVEKLEECAGLLGRFGGHAMAAGLDVEVAQIPELKERFNRVAAAALEGTDLRPVQEVDAWIELAEADQGLLDALEKMAPFGLGNRKPEWGIRGVELVGCPRVVGKSHLKMTVRQGDLQREAIAFGAGDRDMPHGPIDIACYLQENEYMGQVSLQLNVQDFREHRAAT
jgi:single-stranded-DNA-specific exonuclease